MDMRERAEDYRRKVELILLKMRDGGSVGIVEAEFDDELLVLNDAGQTPEPRTMESHPALPLGDGV
jgi:hypothetical protein